MLKFFADKSCRTSKSGSSVLNPNRIFAHYKQIIMNKRMLLLGLLLSFFSLQSKATIVYVDSAHVGGVQNGTSWATAYSNITSAVASSLTDSIWVAKGTYQTNQNSIPSAKIFGGFLNTDTSVAQRNWQNNTTRFKATGSWFIYGGVWINGVTIIGDTVNHGSGIYNGGHASSVITNCTFVNNDHAIYIDGSTFAIMPIITNCTFVNNKTQTNGAGIYIKGGTYVNQVTVPITDCNFTNNEALGIGDGIGAAIYDDGGSAIITNCTFNNNQSNYGGVYCSGNSSESVIKKCTFSGNHAGGGGGALFINGGVTTVDSCVFNNNQSEWYGGAIYDGSFNLTIKNSSFTNNQATSLTYCYGGAIASMNFFPNILNCTFTNNRAIGGIEGDGGSIFCSSGVINNCKFTGNKASRNGGGVATIYDNIRIYNCQFYADTAKQGGAISFNYNGTPRIINCLFNSNIADSIGAAVFIDTGINKSKIINCTFVKNTAVANTATIYNISDKAPLLRNNIVWSNSGGIYNGTATPMNNAYSLVQGIAANTTTHLIDGATNPLFVDTSGIGNYRLQSASPCIDIGNNDSIPAGITTDLQGNSRIYNSVVDLGSYEFNNIPLATNLLSFSGAKQKDQRILLQWQLKQNAALNFELQRSSDGQTFKYIYNGSSNKTEIDNLQYLDQETGSYNFYRLKLLQSNGSTEYSNVIYFDFTSRNESLKIHPNPAKETIHISFTDEKLLHTQAILTDIYGRTIREMVLNSMSQQLSMAGLTPGVYILKTITGNSVKIIKE